MSDWWVVGYTPPSQLRFESSILTQKVEVVEGTQAEIERKYQSVLAGPFTSHAEASTAMAHIDQGKTPKKATGAGKSYSSTVKTSKQPFKLPNPLSGLEGISSVFEAFYANIFDGKMWRSLGWLVLGAILLMAGVLMWMDRNGSKIRPIPVPV